MSHDNRTHSAFGDDAFGRAAEKTARVLGTPRYILGQTAAVIAWIAVNAVAVAFRWDPYPFILLNLAFSTQAAYAAPLILLAQTRQSDRDRHAEAELEERHHAIEQRAEERVAAIKRETDELRALLRSNTELTEQDKALTEQVHALAQEIRGLLAATPGGEDPRAR